MAMSNSFIARTIANFRRWADEPALNAKYTDAVLVEMIEQAYAEIINEVNRNKTEPVVAKFDITHTEGTGTVRYALPYMIQSIYAIYRESTLNNDVKVFYDSRSRYNPKGRAVWVEGHTLHVQPNLLDTGDILTVEYVPSGTARLHTGTCTVDSTGLLVTFGASPTDGALDTHVNSYAGSIFKLVSHTTGTWDYQQERTILSYAVGTRIATLDVALSPNPESNATTSYEIAPAIYQGLDHAVGLYMAWWVVTVEGGVVRSSLIQKAYRNALRNLRLTAYYSNLSTARRLKSDNYDNPRYIV